MSGKVILIFINYWIIAHLVCGQEIDKDVEIISGKDMPQTQKHHPFGADFSGRSFYINEIYPHPHIQPPEAAWKAWSMLLANEGGGNYGEVNFRQVSPINPILVNINVTGLPQGKHAVHIHAFGDMREGCKSTGPHMRSVLIGNIDVPESGILDMSFYSSYIQLFGHRGIVGRSIVIHEKPIDFHQTPDIYGVPVASPNINPVSYQTEEMAVGGVIACGIITIIENKL